MSKSNKMVINLKQAKIRQTVELIKKVALQQS